MRDGGKERGTVGDDKVNAKMSKFATCSGDFVCGEVNELGQAVAGAEVFASIACLVVFPATFLRAAA